MFQVKNTENRNNVWFLTMGRSLCLGLPTFKKNYPSEKQESFTMKITQKSISVWK